MPLFYSKFIGCKTIFCIAIYFTLLGCATREAFLSAGPPKNIITQDNYEDLQLKSREKKPGNEPVYIDYQKEGTYRQSIDIHKKVNPEEANQLRFITVAERDPVDELKMHYENGAKVNFRNDNGETALIKVLDGPYDVETLNKLEYLISIGANLNFKGKSATTDYTTPLAVAIWNSSTVFKSGNATRYSSARKILELLIAEGSDISGLELNGKTPLHIAAESDNIFAAQLLLETGAALAVKDSAGKIPFDFAESNQMVEFFLKYGKKN